MNKLKLLFNPFNIFKPSPVAQKILSDLNKYPLNVWDCSISSLYYEHPKLSYEIYLNYYSFVYRVYNLNLGYFDLKRVDFKCKSQIRAAEKLARDMEQDKVISKILKS